MRFPHLRAVFHAALLSAVCFALSPSQSHAQSSAPKKYTDEEKTGLDHNNIKLDNLIIPAVKLQRVPFSQAIEQIRVLAQENDRDIEPGINIFVKYSPASQARLKDTTITLEFQSVPLRQVLAALAKQADLDLQVEPWAVSLRAIH